MADIFDELTVEETPSGDIFDEVAMAAPASMGELRRREGSGEIASLTPKVDRATGGWVNTVLDAIGKGPIMGTPAGLTPISSRFPVGSPEYEAEIKARRDVLVEGAAIGASMLPGVGQTGSLLLNAAKAGAKGGAAYSAVKEGVGLLTGEQDVPGAALNTAISVGGGAAAGPALAGGMRLASAGVQSLAKGIKRGAAELFRPVELAPEQLSALRSRASIETATGQRIDLGISDVLNSRRLAQEIAGVDELSEPTLKTIDSVVMNAAANTAAGARDLETVSREAFDILNSQKQGIGEQAKKAVDQFARKWIQSVNKAEQAITGQARGIFTGRTAQELGDELKGLAFEAQESAKAQWDALYDAARAMPEYNSVQVDLSGLNRKAADLGIDLVKNQSGDISAIAAPPGARSAIASAGALAGDQPVGLEAARNLVKELGRSIGNPGYLPGVDTRIKIELLQEAKRALDVAVDQSPELSKTLKEANKIYSDNIDRFKSAFSKGILSEVGVEGGATPEAIIRKLQGPDAASNLQQLTELLGEGATAGKNVAGRGIEIVRESILSKAATSGTDAGGRINVGKMASVVNSIPDPARSRLFPDYAKIQDLFLREAAKDRVVGSVKNAKALLENVSLDPADVKLAFEGDTRRLVNSAKKAIAEEAKAADELSRLGLNELSERTAFDLKKWMANPRNQDRIGNTLTQLEKRNPELVKEAKSLFMTDLLEKSSPGGTFNPTKFLELVNEPSLPTGPGAPGVPEGDFAQALKTVFGEDTAKQIRETALDLQGIRRVSDIPKEEKKKMWNYLVLGYTGGPLTELTPSRVASAFGRVMAAKESIRYRIAATMLTDDSLRRAAMQPIGAGAVDALDKAVRVVAGQIGREFGKRSPLYKEIQSIDEAILPGEGPYIPPQVDDTRQPEPMAPQAAPQPPQQVEIEIPNQMGRISSQLRARDEAVRLLNQQRMVMSNILQQINAQ